MNEAYLSLGSNVGDRLGWLRQAMELLGERCGMVARQSSVYETAAWGISDQGAFLNMVVLLQTSLPPATLLETILGIETTMGRHRHEKWGPRIIDIDILFYGDAVINTPGLQVPHPFVQERRFVLVPLHEIAPRYAHPVLHKTISALLADCPDMLDVDKYKAH